MKTEEPPKPILVIYSPTSIQQRHELKASISKQLDNDYHVLILFGSTYQTKVFFQKDQVELDQKMLEELLSIHKR